jgi:hypothetical protein
MDGLVLGGGVGISAHGSVRVVTERTRSGMPETTIGFVPDVGGTLLLSRSPGEAGTHAALTGAHLSGADALYLGLADHFVASGSLRTLAAALESETVRKPPSYALRTGAPLGAGRAAGLDRRLLFTRTTPRRLSAGCAVLTENSRRGGGGCRHDRSEVAHFRQGGLGLAPPRTGMTLDQALARNTAWACAFSRVRISAKGSVRRWWTRTATPSGSRPRCRRSPPPTSRGSSNRWGSASLICGQRSRTMSGSNPQCLK